MKEWQQIGETELVYDGWRKVFCKTMLIANVKSRAMTDMKAVFLVLDKLKEET